MSNSKFKLQENQYTFPYHHLVSFKKSNFSLAKSLDWGLEYYSYVNKIFSLINRNSLNIAEVGCGDGKVIIELAKRYPNINFDGYDLAKQSILFAKAFSYTLDNVSFYDDDFSESKKIYDSIICSEVLEHIPDSEVSSFVDLISNKLSLGGYFIVSVPTKIQKLHKKHYRHYDLDLLIQHTENNFKLYKYFYIYSGKKFGMKLIKFLLNNKFLILNSNFIVNLLFGISKANYFNSNSKSGFHLVAILKKN